MVARVSPRPLLVHKRSVGSGGRLVRFSPPLPRLPLDTGFSRRLVALGPRRRTAVQDGPLCRLLVGRRTALGRPLGPPCLVVAVPEPELGTEKPPVTLQREVLPGVVLPVHWKSRCL